MSKSRSKNVLNGKGLEFALASRFAEITGAKIAEKSSVDNARECYWRLSADLRERFNLASNAAVEHILKLEKYKGGVDSFTEIDIADDAKGIKGDVRDVILTGKLRELGISCKNNHRAFKHPRLSAKIDFVKKWGLDPEGCSVEYWSTIRPVFAELKAIKESNLGVKWKDLGNYQERYYGPVLAAFEKELLRFVNPSSSKSHSVSQNFVSYVIGRNDFYKLMVHSKNIEIEGFNFRGTLGVPTSRYPDHVLGIDSYEGSEYSRTVRFDKGFTFNFRIHNAKSAVETSLKFDIQAIALPPSQIYRHHMDFLHPKQNNGEKGNALLG